jgi:hypothetical protein
MGKRLTVTLNAEKRSFAVSCTSSELDTPEDTSNPIDAIELVLVAIGKRSPIGQKHEGFEGRTYKMKTVPR